MWQDEAACVGVDPAIFFPPNGHGGTTAKTICAQCPVTLPCLALGLELDDPVAGPTGVFGGMTATERTQLFGGTP